MLFAPNDIAYIIGGSNVGYDTWHARCLDNSGSLSHVVPSTIIGLKRYVYDFYDPSVGLGMNSP